ncbi:ATP-dependent helicase [Candidatus Alkanophaga liquidiphilum]
MGAEGVSFAEVAQAASDEEIYGILRPYVARWFCSTFRRFTPPQRYAIPQIMKKRNILISAPTGTGKTLACFLGILNYLCELSERNELKDHVYCLYISPLKALGNDIKRNLEKPLEEIKKLAAEESIVLDIRVAVRTGDTTQSERQSMLRRPPHILITTPETAAIILNAPKFVEHLKKLEFVVVDEIHELADCKRGAHLSITLERLQSICEREFVRVGMSATISPLEEVARFLMGLDAERKPRKCLVADVSYAKRLEIRVIAPEDIRDDFDVEFVPTETVTLYKSIKELVQRHHSTLIFTNTRSGAERVSYKLSEMFEAESIGTHHSSLSREVRLSVEERLKSGEMKAVACSSSLELGIDIGALDACILVGSPKSTTRLIQRVGRSGHQLTAAAEGYLLVTDLDDLVECIVLAKRAIERKLDRIRVVGCALDVLAQHIVGMSLEKKWQVDEAFALVRRAYPYRNLTREQFISVLRYLSGKYSELESVRVYPKIWFDEEEGVFGRRGAVRGIYMTHVGTIPSETSIQVFQKSPRRWIGEIDEPFLEKLERGDVFVLGGKTYRFLSAKGMRAFVEPSDGPPTIPSWIGEILPLEYDSAVEIGRFREEIERQMDELSRDEVVGWLTQEYNLERHAAENIYQYFLEQKQYAGVVPTHRKIVIETFYDDLGRQNIVFHAVFGRRTIDALSRAYAYAVSRRFNTNVAITLNDNGFVLRLPKNIPVEEIPKLVTSDNIEMLLRRSIKKTELFKRRFRHCAVRALMILKQYKGYDISIGKQQRNSSAVLSVVEKIEGFPIVEETFREILEEVMDIEHAKEVLKGIESGEIAIKFVKGLPFPSPFSHALIALQASDIVLMESRRELLRELHRKVLEYIEGKAYSERVWRAMEEWYGRRRLNWA